MSADAGTERTFVMVDLAGFTALTEAHGDLQAADLAVGFAEVARDCLGPEDRMVKTIGDAVLLACAGPAEGLRVVADLLAAGYRSEGFPLARAGLHHGTAVERDGDWFGAAVNLTARIAGRAAGGQVLATEAVARAADQAGYPIVEQGAANLRNVTEPVALWEIVLHQTPADHALDPVCRMLVSRTAVAGTVRHGGVEYRFCSLDCVSRFAADPGRYAGAGG